MFAEIVLMMSVTKTPVEVHHVLPTPVVEVVHVDVPGNPGAFIVEEPTVEPVEDVPQFTPGVEVSSLPIVECTIAGNVIRGQGMISQESLDQNIASGTCRIVG